jgi:hypothetical protein
MVCVVPFAVGVYVTEQLLVLTPASARVQAPPPLKAPLPLVLNVTVPVGSDPPAPPVSATVAVQVVATPTATGDGAQLTVVEVGRLLTLRANPSASELASCTVDPP